MATEKQADPKRWSRQEVAEKMAEYDQEYLQTPSQRQLAKQLDVPRSTLQHWLVRKKDISADPDLAAFFESPVGLAFLHRLVLAAHMVAFQFPIWSGTPFCEGVVHGLALLVPNKPAIQTQ
jgi:hypothetical protein